MDKKNLIKLRTNKHDISEIKESIILIDLEIKKLNNNTSILLSINRLYVLNEIKKAFLLEYRKISRHQNSFTKSLVKEVLKNKLTVINENSSIEATMNKISVECYHFKDLVCKLLIWINKSCEDIKNIETENELHSVEKSKLSIQRNLVH